MEPAGGGGGGAWWSQPHVLLQEEMADPWHKCIGYAVTLASQAGDVVHEALRNETNAMIKSSPVDWVTATGFPGDSNGKEFAC